MSESVLSEGSPAHDRKVSLFNGLAVVACIAILCVPSLLTGIWWYRYEQLTERIVVGLNDVQVEGYYVSPYHGGRVREEYMHTGYYEYIIDGIQYTVCMVSYSETSECNLPKILTIRYDPNDSTHQIISREDNSEMKLSTSYRIVQTGLVEEGEE